MPIPVSCPSCATKLRAPDDLAGKKTKCPGCGQLFQVPAQGDKESVEMIAAEALGIPDPSLNPQEDEKPVERASRSEWRRVRSAASIAGETGSSPHVSEPGGCLTALGGIGTLIGVLISGSAFGQTSSVLHQIFVFQVGSSIFFAGFLMALAAYIRKGLR